MNILITGASSGIGYEMAKILCEDGNKVYGVARRLDRLNELKDKYKGLFVPICADLSSKEECIKLYEDMYDKEIHVLINNAGMGVFGRFIDTDLNKELDMVNINIVALHILSKLFVKDFDKKGRGYIMNVSSSAGFMMGPLFSSYYASKSYVLRLTQAIARELKEDKSNVRICALCPGPVKTEFDKNADVRNSFGGLSAEYVAKFGLSQMFKGKTVIIPSLIMRMSVLFSKFVPQRVLSKITYNLQSKKLK